ncbi:putative anthocyanidin synthase [Helianthus annuus]|nr:putative anthocyanidin synthase [Helianthus annuus]
MVSALQSWPEPVVRVQSLSDSGINCIPDCYVKPIYDRPSSLDSNQPNNSNNIPVIDLAALYSDDLSLRKTSMDLISEACREWGFFQLINHGVSHDLMAATRRVWREFFHLPLEVKQEYANSPSTYEGYGSRLGVEKGAKLDWSDYFFLHLLPLHIRNQSKWPAHPQSCRELVSKYNEEVVKVCGKLMKIFSLNLGLEEEYLENAFGGEDQIGTSLRVNFYPKCPQPDLTLGISPHSDPVALRYCCRMIMFLAYKSVKITFGLQLNPSLTLLLSTLLINSSNAQYKSVEHRVIVNSNQERVSLAFFYNPRGDILIEPAKQLLLTNNEASLYQPMTFNEYRTFIRLNGLHGKSQVNSLKSP